MELRHTESKKRATCGPPRQGCTAPHEAQKARYMWATTAVDGLPHTKRKKRATCGPPRQWMELDMRAGAIPHEAQRARYMWATTLSKPRKTGSGWSSTPKRARTVD